MSAQFQFENAHRLAHRPVNTLLYNNLQGFLYVECKSVLPGMYLLFFFNIPTFILFLIDTTPEHSTSQNKHFSVASEPRYVPILSCRNILYGQHFKMDIDTYMTGPIHSYLNRKHTVYIHTAFTKCFMSTFCKTYSVHT